uniref:Uncharacterized protein n=1 Tax=Eutreptiella gymnastica TaxID=73025 RepID=A0A7S1I5V3_9EUGL
MVAHNAQQALAMDAADGVIDGRCFGTAVQARAMDARSAYAMDAADGRIDGRCFGAPVAVQGAQPGYGAPMGMPMGGAPMAMAPQMPYAQPMGAPMSYGQPMMGGAPMGYGQPMGAPGMVVAGSAQAAFAMDAADGVLDGRNFGSNIGVRPGGW